MPQITSNFILRSKLPNFERDSFNSLQAMWEVDSSWIDEGHISFCKEDGNHYIFNSQNGTLFGEARWKKVIDYYQDDIVELVNSDFVHSVNSLSDLLQDGLASSLSLGRLVYVKENNTIYYNTYDSSLAEQTTIYLEGETGWFRPLGPNVDNFVIRAELNDYVKKDELPSIPEYSGVTEERVNELIDEKTGHLADDVVNASNAAAAVSRDLNDYKTLADQKFTSKTYSDSTYATKTGVLDSVTGLNNRITELNTEIESLKDLDHSVFLTKDEASTTYSTIEQVEELDGRVGLDILSVRGDLEQTNDNIKGTQDDLASYKVFVEETYAKPGDITGRLNNYGPSVDHKDRWIGTSVAGALAGQTGGEISKMNLSYSEVFDKMFFQYFVPEATSPGITMKFVDDVIPDWYDEAKRIILVKAGTVGFDGADFTHDDFVNAIIKYPETAPIPDYEKMYTTGIIKSEGFCRIPKDGEWVYYGQEGNKYHVPSILDAGEYRYYVASYFQSGGAVKDNDGNTDKPAWDENKAVESEDFITVNASKPVYYNTRHGIVEMPLMLWKETMSQCTELEPSAIADQSFMVPRKLKALYIWNGVAGDYAKVPMIEYYDEVTNTTNYIPSGFSESIDENGYYTYIYDTTNGHRSGIKIKVEF